LLALTFVGASANAAVINYDFTPGFTWGTQNPRTGSGGQPTNAGAYATADYVANNAAGIAYNFNDGRGPSTTSNANPATLPSGLTSRSNIYFGGDNTGATGAANPGQQAVSVKLNSTYDLLASGGRLSLQGTFYNSSADPNGINQQAQYNESYLSFGSVSSTPILGDPINSVTATGYAFGTGSAAVWRNEGNDTTGVSTAVYGLPGGTDQAWFDMRFSLYLQAGSLWALTEASSNGGATWTSFGGAGGGNALNLGAVSGSTFGGYLDLTQIQFGSAIDGWSDGFIVRTGDDVALAANIVPEPSSAFLGLASLGLLGLRRRR
jgi:PEP-CTERM motif